MSSNKSILNSIKKRIGPSAEYEYYDPDIIMDINSAFSVLTQLGVGPSTGFSISGKNETWDDYMPDGENLEMIKSYVYLKVRLMFDPPLSSAVTQVIQDQIKELEWRINVAVDPEEKAEEENQNGTKD